MASLPFPAKWQHASNLNSRRKNRENGEEEIIWKSSEFQAGKVLKRNPHPAIS